MERLRRPARAPIEPWRSTSNWSYVCGFGLADEWTLTLRFCSVVLKTRLAEVGNGARQARIERNLLHSGVEVA